MDKKRVRRRGGGKGRGGERKEGGDGPGVSTYLGKREVSGEGRREVSEGGGR